MTLALDIRMFWVFLINIVLVAIYAVMMFVFVPMFSEEKKIDWVRIIINIIFMLLAPIVGPLFLILSELFHRTILRSNADLSDVIFSKERVKTHAKADIDTERNIVPVEEALNITDKGSMRELMLSVIRGDVSKSLKAISMALDSEDSEVSHYAASVLGDEVNAFNESVTKAYNQMQDESDEERDKYAILLLESLNPVLEQHIFMELEQKSYVDMMDEAAMVLYQGYVGEVKAEYLEWVALRKIEVQDFERAEFFANAARHMFPSELGSYTCSMKLYFSTHDKDKFFEVVNKLKSSEIVIDQVTLEQIRMFS